MPRIVQLEPIVERCLREIPETRGDNFILYIAVLMDYIDVDLPMSYVFERHKELKIPSLESITRCRRKLQERQPDLRAEGKVTEARKDEESEMVDYALSDKQWF